MSDPLKFIEYPEPSDWECWMFGSKSNEQGLCYRPSKDNVPNWFVRWMMKICFGCTWVKDKP